MKIPHARTVPIRKYFPTVPNGINVRVKGWQSEGRKSVERIEKGTYEETRTVDMAGASKNGALKRDRRKRRKRL